MSKINKECSFMLTLAVAAVLLLPLPLGVAPVGAAEMYEFKISLEGPPGHSKNLGTVIFADELVKKSGGRLKPTVYHSAQLYKDIHVIKALDMGMVQMGIVGNYLMDGVDMS
jgi:TRAP-type C4-dicarboxylate transport system substrate-binding protein